jgi:signal peptidase I
MLTLIDLLLLTIIIQVIHFLGTWKLYKRAGREAWEAAIPIYNAIVLLKIINRPWWWIFLLFIPVINVIMFPVIWVETARSFGKNSTLDTFLSIFTLGFYNYYLNYLTTCQYLGNRSIKATTKTGEFVSSVIFAVVAATIVHTYVMQPFTIPTSSLEKSLLVGDFLFVSKFHYGARVPKTPISFPMVHDSIPGVGIKSYSSSVELPLMRLPAITEIERNDIVVFNWPVDTVRMFGDNSGKYYHKPIDKKSNYVKRTVGVPGDSLAIIDGKIHINSSPLELPERAKPQYSYIVQGKGQGFNLRSLVEIYNITDGIAWFDKSKRQYLIPAVTEASAKKLENHPNVEWIKRKVDPKGEKDLNIFPNNKKVNWNRDQFGPIYIPEKGKTVKLDAESFSLYRRVIEVYEGSELGKQQKLSIKGNQVYMNDEPIDNYTFKQNYYFMMGDNRHNSEDSRFWGYVPMSHVVGKPVFIWLSLDGNASGLFEKLRLDRMFTTVAGEGERVSYLQYFLIALVLWFGFRYFSKKRKKG